jgi:porphobilinogen synthase
VTHLPHAEFPWTRLRRTRAADWRRRLTRETVLRPEHLILPVFIKDGDGPAEPISALPGVERLTLAGAVRRAAEARDAGVSAVALFPAVDPALKDARGSEALNPDNLVCRAIRAIKAHVADLGVIADVALDPYTDHGHDGLIVAGSVANDPTVEVLARQAVILADAGCDVVAPSDMMDGRVGAIRRALEAAGHVDTMILSYAVKYASAFYGPFRAAVGSRGRLGTAGGPPHKRSYQMDIANADEALREAALDIGEGADLLMVKPAGTSLDIIAALKREVRVPVIGYQVSGEYAALMAAAERGAVDAAEAFLESLMVIRRAGAAAIFTYAALDVARAIASAERRVPA